MVLDRSSIAAVRRRLREIGWDQRGVTALLGEPDGALTADEQESLWLWRSRGDDERSVTVRLFLFGRAVPLRDARAALGELTPWRALGLIAVQRRAVHPLVRMTLHDGMVVASDAVSSARQVLGPTTATVLLERAMLKRPVARALDLGTGAGYLALRLASHARAVVATDVSSRALQLARLSAALNGVQEIEFLASDRFTALGRRRFDQIVGNLPFVIAPGRRLQYRDAGADDALLASVVSTTGRHLVEGGIAQYLGQWLHRRDEDEDRRLAPWVAASGCDALVLRFERDPVDRHACRWLAGPDPVPAAERERRMAAWVRALERAGVESVSTGLWTLRRRTTDRHTMLVEDAPPPTAAELAARL